MTTAHVINLSPVVALKSDVPNSIWYGKDVSYDHLRVFGCKAFVHVPKDERSKLDAKTRQCIFIGYGLDEFGYRLYDPIEKQLVKSRDIIFMKNQTIEDIDKVEKVESSSFDGIVHHDEVPHTSVHDVVRFDNDGDAQNHVLNQHVDVDNNNDIVIDDPVAHEVVDESNIPLWRSTRQRYPSSHYSPNEYVLLTDAGEPECYEEDMEDKHKDKWIKVVQDEMKSLYENHILSW